MVLDIQTVHHILKNTAVQNVNKPFVYITDLTSPLTLSVQNIGLLIGASFNHACDVTLSVYPHRAGLKSMPGHGGNRTYDLWRIWFATRFQHPTTPSAH